MDINATHGDARMTRTITARFGDGSFASRTTTAAYTHAARKSNGAVSFHTHADAARRRAGRYGVVVRTDFVVAAAARASDDVTTWSVSDADGNVIGSYDVAANDSAVVAIRAARADGHAAVRATRVSS
jgi:hypothetical protein